MNPTEKAAPAASRSRMAGARCERYPGMRPRLAAAPVILATMGEPAAALDQVGDQVSCVLSEFLDRQRVVAAGIAGELTPAMEAVGDVLAGGKRLRAAFCYWGWRGAGGQAQVAAEGGAGAAGVFAVAAALELLHAAALVHDDVLDDSDTRRGGPAIPP